MDVKPVTEDVSRVELPRPDLTPPWHPQEGEPIGCHLFDGDARILFGTGYGFSADRLIEAVDEFGGIDVVVIEHGDPDHFGAVTTLKERYDDLTVAVPAADATVLDKYYYDFDADVELADRDEYWGLRAVLVSGHTPGNMAFVDESRGLLFAGDTFVHRESENAEEGEWNGALAPMVSFYNKASTKDARRNTARLADYDFDAIMLTHGADVVENGRSEFETLLADLDAD